jgi:hypothetical protein
MEFGDVFMLPGWVKEVDLLDSQHINERVSGGFLPRQSRQCATLVTALGLKSGICASAVRGPSLYFPGNV